MDSSTAEIVCDFWTKLFSAETEDFLKNQFCKGEKKVYFPLGTWWIKCFDCSWFDPKSKCFHLVKWVEVFSWGQFDMNMSEVQFKAPPASLFPKQVFVGEVCPLGGLCHISWCIVRTKVLCGRQCWSQWGINWRSGSLRWPGWTRRWRKM